MLREFINLMVPVSGVLLIFLSLLTFFVDDKIENAIWMLFTGLSIVLSFIIIGPLPVQVEASEYINTEYICETTIRNNVITFIFILIILIIIGFIIFTYYQFKKSKKIRTKYSEFKETSKSSSEDLLDKKIESTEVDKLKLIISECIKDISKLNISNEIRNNLKESLIKTVDKIIINNDELNISRLKDFYLPELFKLITIYIKLDNQNSSINSVKNAKDEIIKSFVKLTEGLEVMRNNHINKEAMQASAAAQVFENKLTMDGLVKSDDLTKSD